MVGLGPLWVSMVSLSGRRVRQGAEKNKLELLPQLGLLLYSCQVLANYSLTSPYPESKCFLERQLKFIQIASLSHGSKPQCHAVR